MPPHPGPSLPVPATGPQRGPQPWTVRRAGPTPPRATGPVRRYDVSWLSPDGEPMSFGRMAPAWPLFEDNFSALARGALVQTDTGPVDVEDLMPGSMVETTTGPAQLLWIGAMTLLPAQPDATGAVPVRRRLYRVTADAFGLGRPMPDLLLGPAARLVNRSPALRAALGAEAALTPISSLADGMSVIAVTPASAVRVFQLGFVDHRVFSANGVEMESLHPGQYATPPAGPETMGLFLSLFPHVRQMADFGSLILPRLTDEEMAEVSAA